MVVLIETCLPAALDAVPVEADTKLQPAGMLIVNWRLATFAVPAVNDTGTVTVPPADPVEAPTVNNGAVTVGGGGGGSATAMDSFNAAVPVPEPFLAESVIVKMPVTVGVPEMTPDVVFTDKPAGSPVAPKLVGLFVAVIW